MSDALLAAELLAAAPARLGGMWLRGPSAERDAVLAFLTEEFAGLPVRRLPVLNREKRLVGVVSLGNIASCRDQASSATVLQGVAQAHY